MAVFHVWLLTLKVKGKGKCIAVCINTYTATVLNCMYVLPCVADILSVCTVLRGRCYVYPLQRLSAIAIKRRYYYYYYKFYTMFATD